MLAKKRREGHSGELLASNCMEVQVSTASEPLCFFFFSPFTSNGTAPACKALLMEIWRERFN